MGEFERRHPLDPAPSGYRTRRETIARDHGAFDQVYRCVDLDRHRQEGLSEKRDEDVGLIGLRHEHYQMFVLLQGWPERQAAADSVTETHHAGINAFVVEFAEDSASQACGIGSEGPTGPEYDVAEVEGDLYECRLRRVISIGVSTLNSLVSLDGAAAML